VRTGIEWRADCESLPQPFPGFPVELGGFGKLHAPFLTERRTRASSSAARQEIRVPGWAHIWRTALRALKILWEIFVKPPTISSS
jgi:hypothetical protein